VAGTWLLDLGRFRAVLFDVDGTLAETERDGHLPAFNQAFAQLELGWHWSPQDYAWLLKTTGGYERMQVWAKHIGDAQSLSPDGLDRLRKAHQLKNQLYAQIVADGRLPLRPGLLNWMAALNRAGCPWGVVTTTSRGNWDVLWANSFRGSGLSDPAVIVCGEDVQLKKPDPEAYRVAAERLGLSASDCLAVEDSPNGLQAARAIGMPCLVVKSFYFAEADFTGADQLLESHEQVRVCAPA
jgi:HAD superfamily hydrolase (TIGR01509 family)